MLVHRLHDVVMHDVRLLKLIVVHVQASLGVSGFLPMQLRGVLYLELIVKLLQELLHFLWIQLTGDDIDLAASTTPLARHLALHGTL